MLSKYFGVMPHSAPSKKILAPTGFVVMFIAPVIGVGGSNLYGFCLPQCQVWL